MTNFLFKANLKNNQNKISKPVQKLLYSLTNYMHHP